MGGVVPDAPLQLISLPSVPRPLHPLFGQCFCHGNVLVPLLAGHFHRNGIFLGLFLLPRFGFLLVFGFPLHDLALLHDLAVLRPVSPALLVGHLSGEIPVLRFQSFVFQRDLVQHLLPLFLQALFLGSPFPFVGFLQHIQLLGHVAGVGDVHAQCIQIGVQHRFCLGIPALLRLHLLHCFALVPGFLVLRQTPVEFSRLLLLHSPQVFHSLGRTGFVSGCCRCGPALPLLEGIEDGLCVVHLVHMQQVADHPARQLHLGIFVLSHIREPAHHLWLDGVVHVHQHIQPLGALHAGRAVHARCLGGSPEQFRCALLCAAHAPGIVHNGLVFFRRVSVPVSFLLPQLHAVLPGLGHRFAPASVLAHKLRLGFAVLVHGVAQLVVFRVLLPQFCIPVSRLVEDLPGNGLSQPLRLVHVGPFGLHVLDQGAHLAGHTLGVGLALRAAGLYQPFCYAQNAVVAHPHPAGQAHHLGQRLDGRAVVRNGPAGLPLAVPLRIPVGLFGHLEADVRHLVQHLRALRIIPGFVLVDGHALFLQAVQQRRRSIVRHNSRPHLVELHGSLGFRLKVPGGDVCDGLVQRHDLLCRLPADGIAFLRKCLADCCHGLLSLCGPQKDFTEYLPLPIAAVRMCSCLLSDAADDFFDLAVGLFQQCLVLLLRHLLQAAFVCPHFVQILIFCRGRAHQSVCRKAPCAFSACILLVHGLHQILQRVGVVQLGKASPVSGSGIGVLLISDSLFSQNTLHLRQQPLFHISIRGFLL